MTPLTFPTRAKARRLSTGTLQRTYKSADGRYLLIELNGAAGRYWLAGRQLLKGQRLIARCKSRREAEAACDNYRKS